MSYKVKKGDTLSGIAKAHNMSLGELLKLNGISKDKANNISIGQEIKITKDQNPSDFNQIGFKSPYSITMNWKSYYTDDKSMPAPFKEGYTEDNYIKDNAETIQRQLKEAGYNLGSSGKNKDGVDGKWGKNSQAALDKALSEGYKFEKGKLIAPINPQKVESTFIPNGYNVGLVKYLQGQSQKTNSEQESSQEKPSFGTQLNRFINAVNSPRMYVADKITQAGANSNNEVIRGVASAGNILLGGLSNALRARVNSKINEIYPGWIDEKNKDQIGKGYPVWSIDKEFGLARYYDAEGNLLISSPAGTGLVRGNKSREGDNKTPEGVYTLSNPELGKNKKGGEASFGPYFYRTNHKNEDSGNLSGVGLHGTGFPILNGSNVSHGCVRIDNKDIETFYNTAPNKGANTKIIINR